MIQKPKETKTTGMKREIKLIAEFHGHFDFSKFRKSVGESLTAFGTVDKVNYWHDPWFVGLQIILNLKPEVQEEALLADENWPEGTQNITLQ
eukprot:TRINITY_DN5506_c0_g2_i1.p1 TRINITY_DN5506_c0_g2~~TRINITY_DN5506_c0_g2_i1.p1  ORF type:complete len:108 (-),score=31.67 TRINITY_DN5506_c0_g2_i1:145-420(-)